MTTSDVSAILASLALLTADVKDMAVKTAKIEERTSVLADHEVRIRAAEEAARVAGEVATRAAAVVEAQAVRIRTLEDNARTSGRFSWGDVRMVIATAAALAAIAGVIYAMTN